MLEITGLKQEVALPHDVDKLQVFFLHIINAPQLLVVRTENFDN